MQTTSPESAIRETYHWQLRFWLVLSGQTLSLVGSELTQFVMLWWVADSTSDLSALATAGLAALLPQALLAPIGGVLADRYSRRLLLVACDLGSALCMLVLIGLFLSHHAEPWEVYTLMMIRSALQAIQSPAASASVAMLVPETFVARAVGISQTLHSLTRVASPPLGALAASVLPLTAALAIDVVTALLGIVPLLLFRIPQVFIGKEAAGGLWADFQAGVNLALKTPGLRQLYTLLGVVVLTVMPSFTLLPLLVKQHFGGGATQLAILEGLEGVGMLTGGLIATAIIPRKPVPWILFGFTSSCIALSLTALAPSNLFGFAVAWWVISGVTFVVGDVPLVSLLQTRVPPQFQGRMLSLMETIMALFGPIGLALILLLENIINVRFVFIVSGAVGAMVCVFFMFSRKLSELNDA